MKPTLIILFTAFASAAGLSAQRLVAYDNAAGLFLESQPATPLALPSPPLSVYPTFPALPPVPIFGIAPGDSSFDGIAGINYFTDGATVAAMPTMNYPPAGPVPPPIPIPAAIFGVIGAPITGLAIDPATGILWLASAPGGIIGVAPVPGLPVVVPAFVVPFAPPPITGLEWDGLTSSLLAVDVTGTVYPVSPGGAPAGLPIFPATPPPGTPGDVAIDKTGKLNGVGARSIYICAGGLAYDITLPAPIFFPFGVGPGVVGMAFQQQPAESAPFGGCPCGGMMPMIGTTGPMTSGNLAFGLTLSGIPPGTLTLFGLDFGFTPAFPFLNASGCGVGLMLGSATLLSTLVFSDPGGTATYPMPLSVLPGFGPIYSQAFTLCGADPAGFVASPMQQIIVSDI